MSFKTTLLLLSLLCLSFYSIQAQEEEAEVTEICNTPLCPDFMVLKTVNGVSLGFGPCCLGCQPCTDDYAPVCLSSQGTYTTFLNNCLACTSDPNGLVADQACPEPIGTEEGEVCEAEEVCYEGEWVNVEALEEEESVEVMIVNDETLNGLL